MDCTAAAHRLQVGVPATVEHSGEDGPDAAKWVAETTQVSPTPPSSSTTADEDAQNFITFMDALKLKLRAKDQLHPLMSDLMESYTRFKTSADSVGRPKMLQWFVPVLRSPTDHLLCLQAHHSK